jgi:hypothetical protein
MSRRRPVSSIISVKPIERAPHSTEESARSRLGHGRRFRDFGDASGLPLTPERLRPRGESTLKGHKDMTRERKSPRPPGAAPVG